MKRCRVCGSRHMPECADKVPEGQTTVFDFVKPMRVQASVKVARKP